MIFSSLSFVEKLYIVTSYITALGSFLLGVFVYLKNKKKRVNRVYFLTSLSVFVWSFALILCHSHEDIRSSLFWNKILHLGAIFIPITFFHFVVELKNLYKKKGFVLKIGYCLAFLFVALLFTDFFIKGVGPKYDFRVWPIPGYFYPLYMLYHNFYATYSLYTVYVNFKLEKGIAREQLKFILIGVSIAFLGGGTNYLYSYNMPFPPIGNLFVFLYVVFLAYSIVKYKLMDISIVFTRVGIFITVYSLVLGIPVWMGFKLLGKGLWLLPVTIMGIFATAGPFIYLYLQKRAEDALLQEQRRYQTTLRQASAGMGRVKDLKKLLNLIVYVVTRAVRLEHALVYVQDPTKNQFILGAYKRRSGQSNFVKSMSVNSSLITYLIEKESPIAYEELKQNIQDNPDADLVAIEKIILELEGDLVFPILIEKKLLAVVVLGKKESGKSYTEDDLSVFSILANQAALAIENAQFYEDMKKTKSSCSKPRRWRPSVRWPTVFPIRSTIVSMPLDSLQGMPWIQ